ncbi:MAG: hypothetical protein HF314_14910 [Ignavibacteria bacterium]|jgi:hypothetical protein|nr:hypothetical protein [Ignavibacteria bacterium]MCU7504370.1 hypothetical protein [Ignavibacteria bacterium]MCU7517593.1 hypothetical protein [Ignavibacteria bacterium]
MKKALPLILSALFVFSLLSVNLNAQESYKLKYNFQKGKTYSFLSTMDGNFTQEAMGTEMKMSVNGNFSVSMKVDDVKDGKAELITALDSGRISTKNPMKDTTLSLAPFAGKRIKLTMLEDGTIEQTSIIDSIKFFNVTGLSQNNLIRFIKLPKGEVKPGVPWNMVSNDTVEMMGAGKMTNTINSTYTIVGKEKVRGHECLKVTYTGDVKNSGQTQVMGMNLVIEGTGKISGSLYFDPVMGMAIKNDGSMDNEMTMAATGQQNMIMPITQSVKTSISLVE